MSSFSNEKVQCKCIDHSQMICPLSVVSPLAKVREIRTVILNTGSSGFSLATILWSDDGKEEPVEVLAIRWNGFINSDGMLNKGHPVIRGYPTWFVIPDELRDFVLSDPESLLRLQPKE